MRVPRRVLLPTVSVVLLLCGLAAAVVPPTVSAAVPVQHPVRPQVHKLRLAGVDQVALAELREQDPGAHPAILTSRRPTEAFRLLGVSWAPGQKAPRIDVEAPTRGAKGWSRWRAGAGRRRER